MLSSAARSRHVENSLVGGGAGAGPQENPVAAKSTQQQSTSKRKNRPALGEISANTSFKGASKGGAKGTSASSSSSNAQKPKSTNRTKLLQPFKERVRHTTAAPPSEWPDEELQYEEFAGGRSSPTVEGIDKDEREYLGLDKAWREPASPPPPERPPRSSLDELKSIGKELSQMTDDDILNWDLTDEENYLNKASKSQNQHSTENQPSKGSENDLGL